MYKTEYSFSILENTENINAIKCVILKSCTKLCKKSYIELGLQTFHFLKPHIFGCIFHTKLPKSNRFYVRFFPPHVIPCES